MKGEGEGGGRVLRRKGERVKEGGWLRFLEDRQTGETERKERERKLFMRNTDIRRKY